MASESGGRDTQDRLGHNSAIGRQGRTHLGAPGPPTSEGHRRLSRPTSVREPVISIGVIDEKSFTRECITRCLQALDDRFNIVPFATCEDFLESTESHDLALYYIHEDVSMWDNEDQKFLSFKELLNLMAVIILSDVDNPDILIDLFENGARGFVPTDATVEQVIEIIDLVIVGGIFVPLSSLSLQRTASRNINAGAPVSNTQFTPGELEYSTG
jgi:DNA-binding NarL/FixJ family response regulator